MTAPIDKAALARRFLALGPAEQKRFLELLASKGIRFDRLPLVPATRGEHLPASHAQQRLWLVAQLEPDSSAYHMVGAFALDLYKNWSLISTDDMTLIGVGFIAAFFSALVVVRSLLAFVSRRGYAPFAWWRIIIGTAGLVGLYYMP